MRTALKNATKTRKPAVAMIQRQWRSNQGYEHPGYGGANYSVALPDHGVKRHGVHHHPPVYEMRKDSLPRRLIECAQSPHYECVRHNVPGLDQSHQGQGGQGAYDYGVQRLHYHYQALGVNLVRYHSSKQVQNYSGYSRRQSDKPQLYGRARDVIHQPANGHDEHLKAHDGDHLAGPEDAIVPVLQRLEQAQP